MSKLHLPALGAAFIADDEYVSKNSGTGPTICGVLETLGDSWVS